MNERKEGWYWVKPSKAADKWRPDYYRDGKWHVIWSVPEEDPVHFEVGPRAFTPNEIEGWQSTPDVANDEMLEEGVESLRRGQARFGDNLTQVISNIFEDMLSAAPKPGDEI
ncbi:hypothetical protein [Vreelandella populi]|uniref:hypothetical protein n=1 Tax=Vreelandella populi TaxID=2498858 RepID=UPI000F8D414E|nr:hypothetical protein [Halomonas populi]RUR52746.1 hypothetical protein ELY40_11900 [Halomonas populi]